MRCGMHATNAGPACVTAQLKAECAPAELERLRQALDTLTQPAFEYDRVYIAECMGWPVPAASTAGGGSQQPGAAGATARMLPPLWRAPHAGSLCFDRPVADAQQRPWGACIQHAEPLPAAAGTHAARKTRLGPGISMEGHQASIFALAWDAQRRQLASSGKDGRLILWDAQGRQLQRRVHTGDAAQPPLVNLECVLTSKVCSGMRRACQRRSCALPACSLDAREGYAYNGLAAADAEGVLAAVGMDAASRPGRPPCIEAFAVSRGRLERRARALRPAAAIISSLAFLPGSAASFVAGPRACAHHPCVACKAGSDVILALARAVGLPATVDHDGAASANHQSTHRAHSQPGGAQVRATMARVWWRCTM